MGPARQDTQGWRPWRPWRGEHAAPRRWNRQVLHHPRVGPAADLPGTVRTPRVMDRSHATTRERRACPPRREGRWLRCRAPRPCRLSRKGCRAPAPHYRPPGMTKPFNPLDMDNLGVSLINALLEAAPTPLGDIKRFEGGGVYAVYYTGDFPAYSAIAEKNRNDRYELPIYVGRAIPGSTRKGGTSTGRS